MPEDQEIVDLYGASYGGFASDTYAEVHRVEDRPRVFAEWAGLRILSVEDATENKAAAANRWLAARAERDDALRVIKGDETFEGQQRFLEVAAPVARERRLSRFVYLAEKVA